jgi:hypothetical protein
MAVNRPREGQKVPYKSPKLCTAYIDEAEVHAQKSEKQVKGKASSLDQSKSVLLYEDVADQTVLR